MTIASPRRSALGDIADELRESVHAFVQSRSPEAEVRRLMAEPDGFDEAVWAQMAQQLELQGMTIPERFGGAGFALDAQAVVFEEMGAALMCTPYLSTVLAAEAILASGDDAACAEHLPGIAEGATRAALAVTEADGRWRTEGFATGATAAGDGVARLDGEKAYVVDGHSAHALVVAAQSPAGPSLYLVDGAAAGLTRVAIETLDPTRKQARIVFDGVEGRLLGAEGEAAPALERVLRHGAVALAAEQVGGATACLNMSVEYAKDRVQFGRQIGSFQAVKHKCADMLRYTELARATAYEAAITAAADADDAALNASVAKAYCGEAFSWVAAETIHVHGGIGYTWEHPAHLYLRRARSSEQLFGAPRAHRELVLESLGI
jgi:alkylation response protein AidB-like acyl-CoA dehydrogenase